MNPDRPQLTVPVGPPDHVSGPSDAAVVLVEYGDFECPHCGAAFPHVEEVRQRMGGRMAFVYRHFPLTNAHPHAQSAAEAAEAAGAQGRFWEMHAMIFEHQDALEPEDLLGYARDIGLELRQFASELRSGAHASKVRHDFISGVRSGVNGTPTFFINGLRYDGPADATSLLAAIESMPHLSQR